MHTRRITLTATALPLALCSGVAADGLVPLPPTQQALKVESFGGEAADDNFGLGLASAGDFTGNGLPDLIVGAPFHDGGALDGGAAYLFPGGGGAEPAFQLLAEAADDQLGWSVAGIGDFDGDGHDDIAIGARWSSRAGVADRGATWVVFGDPQASGSRSMVIDHIGSSAAGSGHALAGGDFNGSGYADLAIASPFHTEGPMQQVGRVDIFFGGADPDPTAAPDVTLIGEGPGHQFGWSVASAGDVTGNGFEDLLVGARWYASVPGEGRGRAYLYEGGQDFGSDPLLTFTGENADDWLGYDVVGVGDVSANGYDDFLVTAPLHPAGNATGRAYLFSGGPELDATPDLIFDGVAGDDQFGYSADGGLDITGNGYPDIIIGARFNDDAAEAGGAAYIFAGGPGMDDQPDLVVGSANAHDALGTRVAMLGDWLGMDIPLAAATAPWHDGTGPGEAFGAVFAFGLNPGDFNLDGVVDAADINMLLEVLGTTVPPTDPRFDLTGSGEIGQDDLDRLILDLIGTAYADANVDGRVDEQDLAALLANFGLSPAGWDDGNFTGDSRVGLRDASLLLANWGFGAGPSGTALAVPEPASLALLGLGGLLLLRRR